MFAHQVSGDAVERLEVWLTAHCPGALEDPKVLPGLVAIIAEELKKELAQACWMRIRKLREPCWQ